MKLLVTSVRNEAPWLLEWIAFHKAIGFDYFLIYTNDNTDLSNVLFAALAQANYIKIIQQSLAPNESPQSMAFRKAIAEIKRLKPAWVMCIDPDEYVNLHADADIGSFLNRYPHEDAIAINWSHFGTSGLDKKGFGYTVERFLRCAPRDFENNRHFKTIFRFSNKVVGFGPHRPFFKKGREYTYIYPDGTPLDARYAHGRLPIKDVSAHIDHSIAQVNHYAVRSRSEFLVKSCRGNGIKTLEQGIDACYSGNYFKLRDRCEVYDDSILKFMHAQKREYLSIIKEYKLSELVFAIEQQFFDFECSLQTIGKV